MIACEDYCGHCGICHPLVWALTHYDKVGAYVMTTVHDFLVSKKAKPEFVEAIHTVSNPGKFAEHFNAARKARHLATYLPPGCPGPDFVSKADRSRFLAVLTS